MNLFLAEPNVGKVNSMHFYAWENGLKTGMYYLRSKPASQSKKITIEENSSTQSEDQAGLMCSLENPESCEMCSG